MRQKSVRQKGFQTIGKDAPRRATRLEGKVKNRGIQNVRKKSKRSK